MTRLFSLLCDHIKKFSINPHGGYRLLSDISAYHSFCSKFMHNSGENESLRQFDALKEIPNLFLIDDPVALKGLVQEENRYLGVFFIPDLLEFLGCRTDIKQIRPMIEQEGCSIM
jgi:recyclin-1